MSKTSAEQIRAYQGPALFSFGFRPLFLGGALWAALVMGLWVLVLAGQLGLPTRFDPVSWHVHELLYGYLPAVAAGFLLTAVPNWTGRLPIVGRPLVILSGLWLAGRLAILMSGLLPVLLVAAVDLSFLLFFAFVVAREIIAGENWRNLKVLILIGLLVLGNALFHIETWRLGAAYAGHGARLGIGVAVLLIMVIGGRIVPSFTRNWLVRRQEKALPAPMDRFDMVSMGIAALALAFWIGFPEAMATGALCLVAGCLQAIRLVRWRGFRTFAEPLVVILHLGFSFVPLGFLLVGLAVLEPGVMGMNLALHAWTAGAIGVMTLAVMTRATLGHSGQTLHADGWTQGIYGAVILSALGRIASGLVGSDLLLQLSAGLWILGFLGFTIFYGPLLTRAR